MEKIEVVFPGKKKVDIKVDDFIIKTDQSLKNGGDGSAPEPFDLFLSSICACAGVYAKIFCDKRDLNTEGMKLIQKITYSKEKKMLEKINLNLYVNEDFPEKYKQAIAKSMDYCTVKRQLHPDIKIEISIIK